MYRSLTHVSLERGNELELFSLLQLHQVYTPAVVTHKGQVTQLVEGQAEASSRRHVAAQSPTVLSWRGGCLGEVNNSYFSTSSKLRQIWATIGEGQDVAGSQLQHLAL